MMARTLPMCEFNMYLLEDGESDNEDISPVQSEKEMFLTWLHDLQYNRLDPVSPLQHPYQDIFTPYPFQSHKERTYFRSTRFRNLLNSAYPHQVDEIYLFHSHVNRRY